jgi:thiol-disulfide isomerase/thioredoxin
MKALFYLASLLVLLTTACTESAPLSGIIEGSDDKDWGSGIYLIQARSLDELASSYTGTIIDSAIIEMDGSFRFYQLPDAPEPILLQLAVQKTGTRFPNQLENEDLEHANYIPIIWKNGDQLKLTAAIDAFQKSFSIASPSPQHAALLQLRDIRLDAYRQWQQTITSETSEEDLLKEEKDLLQFQRAQIKFANESEYLLPALVAFRWVSPEGNYERIPEFVVNQCEKWSATHPDHAFVQELCAKGNRETLPVLIGDTMPDTALPLSSGETVAVSSLLGKLTIMDLWASWCAPCRIENREVLAPLWEKYQDQGLQVIGYALDASEKAWKKAMEKDGADRWPQASHLQGDDAPLMETLKIQTIPANFILDKEGKVLAKNLHGEELIRFVEEYLAH